MKKALFLIVSVLVLGLLFAGCSKITNITAPGVVEKVVPVGECACVDGDTATGCGLRIKPKGTWFMYNQYPKPGDPKAPYYYGLVAGNPNNGSNVIGYYEAKPSLVDDQGNPVSDHWYVANYTFDETIVIGSYKCDIVVYDEHLAIQDDHNDFTAKPGRDDNADWGVPFYDEDGEFYIFAHFEVEYE